jgi:hypothetical protein
MYQKYFSKPSINMSTSVCLSISIFFSVTRSLVLCTDQSLFVGFFFTPMFFVFVFRLIAITPDCCPIWTSATLPSNVFAISSNQNQNLLSVKFLFCYVSYLNFKSFQCIYYVNVIFFFAFQLRQRFKIDRTNVALEGSSSWGSRNCTIRYDKSRLYVKVKLIR